MFEGRLTRDLGQIYRNAQAVIGQKRQPCLRGGNVQWGISAFSLELAGGSVVVSGSRAASIQASILRSPLGAGDMHVPVNM